MLTIRNLHFNLTTIVNGKSLNNFILKNFARANKSIYSKKNNPMNISNTQSSNTIDITESQKQFELNMNIEKKNLEKNPSDSTNNNKSNFETRNENNFRQSSDLNENKQSQKMAHEDMLKEIKNMNEVDYDFFKTRNKDIRTKSQKSKKEKEAKEESNMEENENEEFDDNQINQKALFKLQEIIEKDQKIEEKENYKNINKDEQENEAVNNSFQEEEKSVLVNRPLKNFVWGLGQQTKQKKFKFAHGELPTVEACVNFLEVNNLNEIIVVPTHKLGLLHLKENAIICSGHTTRHIYKIAKDLVVDLKKLNIPNLPFIPTVFGRRESEWILVEIGEIQIHFFTTSYRKENDLLDRWLNPVPDDYKEWSGRVQNMFYGKKKLNK